MEFAYKGCLDPFKSIAYELLSTYSTHNRENNSTPYKCYHDKVEEAGAGI